MEDKTLKAKQKPMTSSKTIKVGTIYISLGLLVGILQMFDVLETVLTSINAENVPPNVAAWGGLILAIIGGIQVWLRMITSQPIGSDNDYRISAG
jgi:Mg2+/citrate symporter